MNTPFQEEKDWGLDQQLTRADRESTSPVSAIAPSIFYAPYLILEIIKQTPLCMHLQDAHQ